jgi:hypothetical protein
VLICGSGMDNAIPSLKSKVLACICFASSINDVAELDVCRLLGECEYGTIRVRVRTPDMERDWRARDLLSRCGICCLDFMVH